MGDVVVPDEAVEAACAEAGWDWRASAADHIPAPCDVMRDVLSAAAPAIVAANRPVADADLRTVLTNALTRSRCTRPEPCNDCRNVAQDYTEDAAGAVEAFVAAQVTAARAEERVCLCDGGAYEIKRHPFIVNNSCEIHGSPNRQETS